MAGSLVDDRQTADFGRLLHLKRLDIVNSSVTAEGWDRILRAPELTQLYLTGATDKVLTSIAQHTHLTELQIGDSHKATTAGILKLGSQTDLTYLKLSAGGVTDEGLAFVSGLSKLESLTVNGKRGLDLAITNKGLRQLRKLKKLAGLHLGNVPVMAAGLQEIAQISSLKRLALVYMDVADDHLKHLSAMSGLESLTIQYSSSLTGAGIQHLRGLLITELSLISNQVSDESLGSFSSLAALRNLNLGHNQEITDEGIDELRKLKSLQNLSVSGTRVTEFGAARVRTLLGRNCTVTHP